MIETPDITIPSSDVMFEHDGNKFTLAQVQEAADKTGVSLEEYVSKYKLNKVKPTENVPVENNNVEARKPRVKPDTNVRNYSVRGRVRARELKRQKERTIAEAQNTYDKIQKELKNLNPEYINSTFGNNYFDLANIPSEWVPSDSPAAAPVWSPTTSMGMGSPGGYSKRMSIEEYLGPEKYKQYQQYLNGGVEAIEPINEENRNYIEDVLTKSTTQVRNQTSEDLTNEVPDHIRRIMPNSAGEFKTIEEAYESFGLIKTGIDMQREDHDKNIAKYEEQEKKWVDGVEQLGKQIDDLTNEYGKINPNSPPEVIEKYNNLVTAYDQQIQQYETLGLNKLYNDLILESENINSSIEDFNNKIKGLDPEYDLETRAALEKALKLDYRWSTRVGFALENFIGGGLVNTALIIAQTGVAAVRDLRKLKPVPTGNMLGPIPSSTVNEYDDTAYNNTINYLKGIAQDYNLEFDKRKKATIPGAYTLDDLDREEVDFWDWFSNATADNTPSILTTLASGGAAAYGRSLIKGAIGSQARKQSLKVAKNYQKFGLRTAQATFFTAETGGKYGDIELTAAKANEQLPFLRAKLAKAENLEEKTKLQQDIEDLEIKANYPLLKKAFTSFGYGGWATYAETFGSLRFVQAAQKNVSMFGLNEFKKGIYKNKFKFYANITAGTLSGLGKVATQASAINLIEEGLTEVGHKALDRYVLGADVSLVEGLDKDFFANTVITSAGMMAPRAGSNLYNLFTNEFATQKDLQDKEKLVNELITIQTTKTANRLKGKARLDANKRQNEIIRKLGLQGVLSLHKIRYLTTDQIREVGDINRRIHKVQEEFSKLGQIGDPFDEQNKAALDRLNKQLENLVNQKENILKQRERVNRDEIKKLREETGIDLRSSDVKQGDVNYWMNVNAWAQDLAMLMQPKDGEYLVVQDEKDLEKILKKYKSKKVQDDIKKGYEEGNYAFKINNDIIIFDKNTKGALVGINSGEMKYAAISPLEEIFHLYTKEMGLVDEKGDLSETGEKAVNEAIETLKQKKENGELKISNGDYNTLLSRFELYKEKGKIDYEELLAQLNNAVTLGVLDLNDFNNMPLIRQLLNGMSNKIFGDASWTFQFNSNEDVFNFIKKFQKTLKSEVALEGTPEDEEIIKFSKIDSDRVDALVGKKVDGKYTMTKQEWDAGGINQAYTDLIVGDGLDKLINKGIFGNTIQGKSREEFVQDVKNRLTDELIKFNPEINNSLSGYINSLMGFRKGDTLKAFKKEETASLDKIQDATGKAIAGNIADTAAEVEVDTPKQVSSKLRKIIGVDTKRGKEIARNVLKGKLPAVTDKKFTTAINKQARDEYLDEIRDMINDFSAKQKLDIVNTLPLKDLVKLERLQKDKIFAKVVKDNIGPIEVDKAIAEGKLPKGTNRLSGPKLYERLPVTATQVSEFFGPKKRNAFASVIAENLVKDALPEVTTEPTSIKQRAAAEQSQGRKTTDADRANILSVIDRDPYIKFAKTLNSKQKIEFDKRGVDIVSGIINAIDFQKISTYRATLFSFTENLRDLNIPLKELIEFARQYTPAVNKFIKKFKKGLVKESEFGKITGEAVELALLSYGIKDALGLSETPGKLFDIAGFLEKFREINEGFQLNQIKKLGDLNGVINLLKWHKDYHTTAGKIGKGRYQGYAGSLDWFNSINETLKDKGIKLLIRETGTGWKVENIEINGVKQFETTKELNKKLQLRPQKNSLSKSEITKNYKLGKKEAGEAFYNMIDYLDYVKKQGDKNQFGMALMALKSNMSALGKRVAYPQYFYVGKAKGQIRFEHMYPSLVLAKDMVDHFYGDKKVDLKQLKELQQVAMIPVEMDERINILHQDSFPSWWNKSMGVLPRYYNTINKGYKDMYALESIGGKDKGKIYGKEFLPLNKSIQKATVFNKQKLPPVIKFSKSTNDIYNELRAIEELESNYNITPKSRARREQLNKQLKDIKLQPVYDELQLIEEYESTFKITPDSKARREKLKDIINQEVLNDMAILDTEQSKAQIKFSKSLNLSNDFNKILENKTGIGAEKIYSDVKAQVVGASKGKFKFFIPPSAEDFVGLLYATLGKGKLGDAQMAWYKKHLLDPFARAMDNISRDRIALMSDFKKLKEDLQIVPKNLKKKLPGDPYTQEQAVRVYIWTQQDMRPDGMSQTDINELVKFVESKPELVAFANQLIALQKGDSYAPPKYGWLAGNITTDLMDGINTIKRPKYLEQWQYNVDEIFSNANLNKLEAAFGKGYRDALENILKRMRTGRNREFNSDTLTGRVTDWLTNSIGAIMFFNTRSAVLQTISAVNFINFKDNNIFAAGKAFANQPQFWKDFITLMNSDFLLDRRNGLRLNVNENDIADMAKKGGVRGVISEMLRLGFLPTQIADSFAIASGGATFYRNRINTYKKEGLSQKEAQEKAFVDFREIAEESQQSSRPDRISKQQASPLGRIILAFANTPMQYARLIKKAASDLKNGRGDTKTNISKILYYGFVQNLLFNAMQQALFALGFGDEEEEKIKRTDKYITIGNNMADSILRGLGVGGAIVSVLKNTALAIARESDKKRPEYQDKVIKELLRISPPISSKVSKVQSAFRAYDWNKKDMMEKGWSLDNPAYLASAQLISAGFNIPLDRVVKKINNIKNASSSEYETWARIAMLAGWQDWELGVKKEKTKSTIKKVKKPKKRKKPKRKF